MSRTLLARRPLSVLAVTALSLVAALVGSAASPASSETGSPTRYLVVFVAAEGADGSFELGGDTEQYHALAVSLIEQAGGSVANDLSDQIGVMVAESSDPAFAGTLSANPLVEVVGEDGSWQGVPTEASVAEGAFADDGGGGPEPSADPLEPAQWSMQQIHAPEAHGIQAGWRAVDVGILDTGIDARHIDFDDDGVPGGATNVDCARGRNSITFLPDGPGVGTPDPCVDNQFHGTHVAGIVAAQANGFGVVGVAPNVTLVPVKVCDSTGFCYASAVVDGITYAGDQKLDVINMSFFVDDDSFQQSHEYKCMDDPVQRAFRRAVERAVQYARNQGVTPVAALGNSDDNLADPPEPYENHCDVVPAETSGVIGTTSLGPQSEKARYSNWGNGAADEAAPGGNGTTGDCTRTVLSLFPNDLYVCIQGTSMASPHAAGVAALIVSQFGKLGADGDVVMQPTKVESYLQSTTWDIGETGYDECFGNGRIDALRAVQHDTSTVYDPSAPFCPEYQE